MKIKVNFPRVGISIIIFEVFRLNILSPGGGIGRRAGFKIQFWQQSVGSIPTLGTIKIYE